MATALRGNANGAAAVPDCKLRHFRSHAALTREGWLSIPLLNIRVARRRPTEGCVFRRAQSERFGQSETGPEASPGPARGCPPPASPACLARVGKAGVSAAAQTHLVFASGGRAPRGAPSPSCRAPRPRARGPRRRIGDLALALAARTVTWICWAHAAAAAASASASLHQLDHSREFTISSKNISRSLGWNGTLRATLAPCLRGPAGKPLGKLVKCENLL
jgi:hypothetical protein